MPAPMTLDQAHDLATRRLEAYRRFARIGGWSLIAVGIGVVALPFITPVDMLSLWYAVIRQMTCTMGLILVVQTYLTPKFYPNYHKPMTTAQQKEYRQFLYGWVRPVKESMLDGLRAGLIIGVVPAIALFIWLALPRLWPDVPQAVYGVLFLCGFAGFIALMLLGRHRIERNIEAWYTAHIVDDRADT